MICSLLLFILALQNIQIVNAQTTVFERRVIRVFESLDNNAILTEQTELYCKTDLVVIANVIWNYIDRYGVETEQISTTNTIGESFLTVNTDSPGLYSCEISINGDGTVMTFFATMLVPGIYQGDPFASFHYGIIPSYSFLSNAIITQTSTLYCVGITSTSSWTYTDLEGRSRPLTGTTGANAIVNVLEVKIDNPGTYSCEVTLADTSTEVFSVHLFPSSYTKPTTGCQAISSNGWCFNIELNFLTWDNAQQSCRSNGENLATVYSDIENDALSTLGSECWLGYNNLYNTLDTGRFSWIDGSPITYTRWLQDPTQPDNLDQEVATRVNSQKFWYDRPITQSACYFCGKYVYQFGRAITSGVYTPVPDNSVLSDSTTLICLTEVPTSGTYTLTWKYEPLDGSAATYPSGMTDATLGYSTLSISELGYYSCTVTENGGSQKAFTITLLDLSIYTLVEGPSIFYYTHDIDREEEIIYCHKPFESISFLNHQWVDTSTQSTYSNPLSVLDLPTDVRNFPLDCEDTVLMDRILTITIVVQGPPVITLNLGGGSTITAFSLLPLAINKAYIDIYSENVILRVNLDGGEWEKPDGSIERSQLIFFSTFGLTDEGLYSFYVTNWNNERTLAIQISILFNPFGQVTGGGTGYPAIPGYSIFDSSISLYCIPDDPSDPVSWYNVDLDDVRTEEVGASFNGISTLFADISNRFYSCEVTLEDGSIITHTALYLALSSYTVVETSDSYTYTEDIDTGEENLFCHKSDNSVPFADTVWRELGSNINMPNPLTIGPSLLETGRKTMECINSQTSEIILVIDLLVQGTPEITLETDIITTFTYPTAAEEVVTLGAKNVLLSINLVGRWMKPDASYEPVSYIIFPSFEVADTGEYTFLVTNWDKTEVTAYTITISVFPTGEQITANSYERLTDNSILTASTTLYCITDTTLQSDVTWEYTDTTGSTVDLTNTVTEAATGISLLAVTIDESGIYTCGYSNVEEFSIALLDPSIYTVAEIQNDYTYTRAIDPEDTFLFCYRSDIPFDDTVLTDDVATPTNPVNVGIFTSSVAPFQFNCKSTIDDSVLFSVNIYFQGPPSITLDTIPYELLPPYTNRAYINLMEDNVNMLANIEGRWQKPNGVFETSSSMIFTSFDFSDAGLYKFYVISFDNVETLAIQILLIVYPFGEQSDSTTYDSLEDNTVLTSATTLYCITELTTNRQAVIWTKQDFGSSSSVTIESTSTDAGTGFSSLVLDITQPAYYSCDVLQDEIDTVHGIVLLGPEYTVVEVPQSFTFTDSIDSDNTHLFCQMSDRSVEIDTMVWDELDSNSPTTNPLDIGSLTKDGNIHTYICSDPISVETILSVNLLLQGPPIITLDAGSVSTFSDLSTDANKAYINYKSNNVELSINLVGRWMKPDGSYEEDSSIVFTSFELADQGDYKFYVNTWDGSETLAIQIKLTVYPFGEEINPNTYMQLEDNTVFTVSTTLYCITEFDTTPNVVWKYIDFDGEETVESTTTDPTHGFSQLTVAMSGYYTCDIQQDGSSVTYYVAIVDPAVYTVVNNHQYFTYTINIHREDEYLFCHNSDNSVRLDNIEWREEGMTDSYTNPLSIDRVPNDGDDHRMECFDKSTGVALFDEIIMIQGPPVITLNRGSVVSFLLLPPQINIAYVTLYTTGVVLGINLIGGWTDPTGDLASGTSITFPVFDAENEGLYKFNVPNWGEDGEMVPIQILLKVYPFGEQIDSSTFQDLSTYSVLTANTNLYCINGDRRVSWMYQDLSGTITDYKGTVDASGASILPVSTGSPGLYSCQFIEDDVTNRYTVALLDPDIHEVIEVSESYSYTISVDQVDTFLYCHKSDNSISLSNIHWREISSQASFKNPLDVYQVAKLLEYANSYSIECIDIISNEVILSVDIYIQGPPLLTLNKGTPQSFSLLAPKVNKAYINVLTENVVLTSNLAGTWQRPDETHVSNSSLTFPSFDMSDTGLYKVYVTDWINEQTVAIQIRLLLSESYPQGILDLTAVTSSDTSILITWSLLTDKTEYSQEIFSIYYGYEGVESLAGTTDKLYFSIDGLTTNFNYTIRVDLNFALSAETFSYTIYHTLMPVIQATPAVPQINPLEVATPEKILIAVIAFLLLVIVAMLIAAIIVAIYVKKHFSNDVKEDDSYGLTTYTNK